MGNPEEVIAAVKELGPGIASQGMFHSDKWAASSSACPKTNGSPPLSRTTVLPWRDWDASHWLIRACDQGGVVSPSHRITLSADGMPSSVKKCPWEKPVNQDRVGRPQRAVATQRHQVQRARSRADKIDLAGDGGVVWRIGQAKVPWNGLLGAKGSVHDNSAAMASRSAFARRQSRPSV